GRPRIFVIGEHDAVPDEHLVLDAHAFADEAVRGDFAASSDRRAGLDFNKRPDPGLVTNRATIQVDEIRMEYSHVVTELDVFCDRHGQLLSPLTGTYYNSA